MALPVQLALHDDEAPIDFVARLVVNGYPSLRSFLSHTDITASDLVRGEAQALAIVSEWTNIEVAKLGRLTSSVAGPSAVWRLGNATLSKEMRPGRAMRFCAACVMDDREHATGRLVGRAYRRAWWSVRGIESCSDHGCQITSVAVAADVDIYDFPMFVGLNIRLIAGAAGQLEKPRSPSLDRYLCDRILWPQGHDFFGGLEAHVAAEFCRYLGEFMDAHGMLGRGEDGDVEPREAGFRIASKGADEVRRAIIQVIDEKRPSTKFVEKTFGTMIEWIRRNSPRPSYSPIVDLLQDTLEHSMPFGPGQTIIRPVETRHLYCVNSAHAEFGLTRQRIRALMEHHDPHWRDGMLDSAIYVAAHKLRPILEEASKTLNAKEAAKALGVYEERLHGLLDAGFLKQVERRPDEDRAYARIRPEDVEALFGSLAATIVSPVQAEGFLTLSNATRRMQRSYFKILSMIMDGSLQAVAVPGDTPNLGRIRLNPAQWRPGQTPLEGGNDHFMRLKEVERALGTSTKTVSSLIARGYLLARKLHRPETGREVVMVSRLSLTAFQSEHVSLSAIAQSVNGYRASIKQRLEEKGIAPIFQPEDAVASFYRASDLLDFKP